MFHVDILVETCLFLGPDVIFASMTTTMGFSYTLNLLHHNLELWISLAWLCWSSNVQKDTSMFFRSLQSIKSLGLQVLSQLKLLKNSAQIMSCVQLKNSGERSILYPWLLTILFSPSKLFIKSVLNGSADLLWSEFSLEGLSYWRERKDH